MNAIKGPQRITIIDDGTLDFVVSFVCPDCGETVVWRFEQEYREHQMHWWGTFSDWITAEWENADGSECECGEPANPNTDVYSSLSDDELDELGV